jgi:hypothetical protein
MSICFIIRHRIPNAKPHLGFGRGAVFHLCNTKIPRSLEVFFLVDQPASFWNQLISELKQVYAISFEARQPEYMGI